jgi:hypothetical protein
MSGHHETERARAALHAIPADLSREDWTRAGMAAKAAGLGLEDFIGWSANAGNYAGPKDCASVWQSFKGEGIGPGTLFYIAKQHGWRDDSRSHQTPAQTLQKAPQRAQIDAGDVWDACEPASPRHGYIQAKRGTAEGLRQVPADSTLRIAGHDVSGWLVVPCATLAGELQTLQFVPPPGTGRKLNLPGSGFGDGLHIVGSLDDATRCHVVEGIGQAWACWQATGQPCAVTFGASRFLTVAKALRLHAPALPLVLVPDTGKEQQAEAIAREHGCSVARMPEGASPNFDANDFALRDGLDALKRLLAEAIEPPAPEPRFKLLSGADIEAMPPIQWRIKGLLPTRGLAQIYGPSKAGKSFLAFDMAAAVAEGCEWFGYRVNPAPVVFLALEGEAGFKLRAEAWKRQHGRELPADLRIVMQDFRINRYEDVQDLAAVVPTGAVVFIDTQNRSAPDADENSSRDMGLIIEGAKTLQSLIDGLAVLVTHTGKDASRGPRGHSSQIPAVDAAVEVQRNGDSRSWRADKVKDGTDGAEHSFGLEIVELGTDDDGDPLTSCIIVPEEAPARSRQKPQSAAMREASAAYCVACDEGRGLLDSAGKFIGLHVEDWRPYFYETSTSDGQDGKKKAFQRARKDLVSAGLASVSHDVYRLTEHSITIFEKQFMQAALERDTGQERDMGGTSPEARNGLKSGTGRDTTLEGCPDVPLVPALKTEIEKLGNSAHDVGANNPNSSLEESEPGEPPSGAGVPWLARARTVGAPAPEKKASKTHRENVHTLTRAFWAGGAETRQELPYVSRSAMRDLLISDGASQRAAQNKMDPTKKDGIIASLLAAGVIEDFEHGWLIVEQPLASTLMPQRQS